MPYCCAPRASQQGERHDPVLSAQRQRTERKGNEDCTYVAKTPKAQPAEQTTAPAMETPHAAALAFLAVRLAGNGIGSG